MPKTSTNSSGVASGTSGTIVLADLVVDNLTANSITATTANLNHFAAQSGFIDSFDTVAFSASGFITTPYAAITTMDTTDITVENLHAKNSNNINFDCHLWPTVTGTYDIGSAGLKTNSIHNIEILTRELYTSHFQANATYDISNVTVSANLRPTLDNAYAFGSAALRWSNIYNLTTNTNAIASSTGTSNTDLTLRSNLVPYADSTLRLGKSGFNYLETLVDKVSTDELHQLSGTGIVIDGSLIPSADFTYRLGSAASRFMSAYAGTCVESDDYLGTTFTAPATSGAAGVSTVVPVSVANGIYNIGTDFKFPFKGYYILSFMATWATSGLLNNNLEIMLYHLNSFSVQATHTEDSVDPVKPKMITFGFWINNALDIFQIRVRGATGVSNFTITFGRLIACSKFI